ncbi:MAG TPA: helix-turn-helix transcriptional regulator [Thermoanaerobaculia bacterium]|nr:helix-turn-helix transcriptional regulator [Thermoanaerobaculia bacterium]
MEPEIEDESEARSGEDSWAQAETRRLMELVRFLARTLGVNNSALARNANVPLATLVRYFKGEGEPKLEFLLAMVQALGLEVREFFELAYPDAPPLTPARAKIGRIMQAFQPTRPAAPPPPAETSSLQRNDMEQMMERLRNDMRELLAERGGKAAPRKGKGEG